MSNKVFVAARVDESEGVVRAVVAAAEDNFNIGIVCEQVDDEWKPLFGIDSRYQCRIDLPPCFVLDELAVTALNGVLAQENMA